MKALKDRLENYPLTAREMDVIRLLSLGITNKEIADRLNMSEQTAKNHIAAIYLKLEVYGRTSAVVSAHKRGIIDLDQTVTPER